MGQPSQTCPLAWVNGTGKAVNQAAVHIRCILDARCILVWRADLAQLVRQVEPGGDACGRIVRFLRERAGVSRSALARAMERTPETVGKWEDGKRTQVNIGDLHRAADFLGYSPSALCEVAAIVERPVAVVR